MIGTIISLGFVTISVVFSFIASDGGVCSSCLMTGEGGDLFTRLVMSVSGNASGIGSGDFDGVGVGRGGTAGMPEAFRGLRNGAALFLRGDARFEGDEGSVGTAKLVS